MRTACVTLVVLALAAPISAAEIGVSYLVDSRALRGLSVTDDVLTFELYADPACRRRVHAERVVASRVQVLRTQILPAARLHAGRLKAATLRTVLHPSLRSPLVYLRVHGPGVRPLGGACQAQPIPAA